MKKSARFNVRNILASTVIVAFGLGVGYIMFQSYVPVELRQGNVLGASTFSMPKIGADALADPEYYTPALAGIGSEDEIRLQDAIGEPSRSETPPGPVYGFSLKADSKEDLNEISFIVHKQDGNVVGPYLVEVAEDLVDREGQPISGAFTDPYLFAAGIEKVDFFNTDNKEFTIKYIEFVGQGDEDQVNTQTVVSDANRLYKERFMQEAGLNIVTRDEYGAADDNIFALGWAPPYYAVNRIVVHHTATGVDMGNPANTVAAIWRYHTYDLDWGDVGYNFLIDPYGNIYEGRAGINGVRGNHAPPNEGSIGISLLGDFTNQLPTQAALDSLVRLTAYLAKVNQINLVYKTSFDSANPEGMYGHRAINATACPGNTFFPILPQIRDAAASLMAQQGEIDVKINKVNSMVDGREYYQTDTATQILIKLDGLPDLLKEKLKNPPPRFALKLEQDDSLIYEIPKDMLKQSLTELKVVAPEAVSQPNYKYELQAWAEDAGNERSVPTDYSATEHWYLEQIQAPEAWYYLNNNTDPASHTGSSSVKVAVIDTGVAYEDFNFNAGSEYDRQFYKSPDLDNATFTDPYDAAFDWFCQDRSLTLDPCSAGEWAKVDHANDDQGHGTFVSSVIGATISDAAPNILLGIAPSVKIIPIKVSLPVDSALGLDSGAIYTNFLEMGIDHARVSGANVINISLGAESSEDPYLLDAINDAYDAGITIVASSGNHTALGDAEYVLFPASLDTVIAVGASNYAGDARAGYSNYGPELDVVAPVGSGTGDGGVIATTLSCFTSDCTESSDLSQFPANGSYIRAWGTSFAAPQVAAQVALLQSINPGLSFEQIQAILQNTSVDIPPSNWDQNTGYGDINLFSSVNITDQDVIPQIASIVPDYAKAKGGEIITINGSNFEEGLSIYLGQTQVPSGNITFNNANQIQFKTPLVYAATVVDLKVSNPSSYFDIAENGFEYLNPLLNFLPYTVFRSGQYNWGIENTKYITSGDYNGDGRDEIAAMYDYGNEDMALIVFSGDGSSLNPTTWFRSEAYNWGVPYTKYLTSGDFDNDGKDEIAAMYDYGNEDMALIVFDGVNNNFYPSTWFRSGAHNWGISYTRFVNSGDMEGDGKSEITAMYDYGNQDMAIIVFSAQGNYFTNSTRFRSGVGNWGVSNTKYVVTGNVDSENKAELIAMYDYGNQDMSLIKFKMIGGFFYPTTLYRSGVGNWGVNSTKFFTSGDFNNDESTDLIATYDYGYQDMAHISFYSTNYQYYPATWYRSGIWNWSVSNTKFITSGDYNGDGIDELMTIYDYGNEDMALIKF